MSDIIDGLVKTRKSDKIYAKLVGLDRRSNKPLFAESSIRNGTSITYEGIPVYLLSGFTFSVSAGSYGLNLTVSGSTIKPKSIEVMDSLVDICKDVNTNYKHTIETPMILVFALDDESLDFVDEVLKGSSIRKLITDPNKPIVFNDVDKIKVRSTSIKIDGFIRINRKNKDDEVKFVDKDGDLETKSFVVDTDESVEVGVF